MVERQMAESPIVFDRLLQRRRRQRAAALSPENFLLEHVAGELADRLSVVLRRFEIGIDLGTPGDAVRASLRRIGSVATIVGADVIVRPKPFVIADEEALPFGDAAVDLVVSGLGLQFVNDLPGALTQIRRALKPDGLFLAALLGGETLTELRQAFAAAESEIEGGVSPRVAPFADLRQLGALLQRAGFALPVTDVERVTVRYDSAFDLMRDLRRMGATNPLVARRSGARRFCRWRTFMPGVSPMAMGAFGRLSTLCGWPAGRRIPISNSRSSRARQRRG